MLKKIIGHQTEREKLNFLIKQDRLPSAIIIGGQESIGKFLVALEVAKNLICLEVKNKELGTDCHCKNCLLFSNASYPDLQIIDASDESQRNIESIRERLNSLTLKSFTGFARILIIRDADKISTAAANLLLKAIEESRSNTYFILTSSNLNKIPNTVRSRSQVINLRSLCPEEVKQILCNLDNQKLDPQKIQEHILTKASNVQQALITLTNWDKFSEIDQSFELLIAGDKSQALKLANLIHSQKEESGHLIERLIENCNNSLKKEPTNRPLAILLENLLTAERYIRERHLNSQYLLCSIFLNFKKSAIEDYKTSIEQIIVSEFLQE